MAVVNRHFFVIRISKAEKQKKKAKLTISTVGFLGLKYTDQAQEKPGFTVHDTEKDSPADLSGLRRGDRITSINGITVADYNAMINEVMKYPPNTEITIGYVSSFSIDDTVTEKKVTLAERPLRLDIPENDQDMRFNLQFGEIVAIGTQAAIDFPEAALGDMLLVHHSVEYKQRAEGDQNYNDWHLIEQDEHFEYRIAHATKEVFGVWKRDRKDIPNAIIPYPDYIFCHAHMKKAGFMFKDGIYQPDGWEKSMEDYNTQLEVLKNQIEELNTSTVMHSRENEDNYKEQGEIKKAIDAIDRERLALTRKMHQKKLMDCKVIFVSPKTNEEFLLDIEPGDTISTDYSLIYPLDIFGAHYALLRPQHCEYLIKQ